jgi:hypothetical protein
LQCLRVGFDSLAVHNTKTNGQLLSDRERRTCERY